MANQVHLYGTNWCPDSNRSRRLFDKREIDYVWYDIDRDKDARAFVEKVNNGNRSVPTILFPDGSILVEPGNSELEKKLAELP